jgi:hypothetical protein
MGLSSFAKSDLKSVVLRKSSFELLEMKISKMDDINYVVVMHSYCGGGGGLKSCTNVEVNMLKMN